MSTQTSKVGSFSRRILAVGAVTAIIMSLALTAIVLANDLNQFKDGHNPDGISWDDPNFPPGPGDCDNVKPGEVLWHFIHSGTDGNDLPAELTAEFDSAGVKTADGYSNGGGNAVVQYNIITGQDTLLSASDDISDDNLLNLSHICVGAEASVEESVAESEAASVEQSTEASGEQSEKAGEGTPEGSQGDTSFLFNGSGPLATIAFSLILLASLGTLAYANVKSVRSRNQ